MPFEAAQLRAGIEVPKGYAVNITSDECAAAVG
jgi:hypothetical protein